jgi:ribosomal protein S18 acetylase RimI-like enzyme
VGFVRACLADTTFASGPEGVQVGSLEGHADGAFVMTQVRRETLRARITYLGLAPELRRRGLGSVVHARGLAIARAQGATSYQGGTSTENAPMRGLFRALGAREVLALERWVHAR